MSTKCDLRETEIGYPVYDRAWNKEHSFTVELPDGLEQEYFDALATFEDVRDRFDDVVMPQVENQREEQNAQFRKENPGFVSPEGT